MPHVIPPSGRKLWYAQHGKEARPLPLVLIHGAGGSHLDWPPALRRIVSDATCTLAPDLPGHGRSDPPGRDSVGDYARDIAAWLEAMDISQAVFCGQSMGGAIAQTLALDRPDLVRALVLIATGARLPVSSTLIESLAEDPDAAYDRIAANLYQDENARQRARAWLDQVAPEVMIGDLRASDAFDARGRLGAIRAPALVIHGTADQTTPLKFGEYLAEHIPHAQMTTIEGAGHMVSLQRPAAVAEAVARFLERYGEQQP